MTEQNFKPSLSLQAVRELSEMACKKNEDFTIATIIGCYPNENLEKVLEWGNEVDKLLNEVSAVDAVDKTVYTNPSWCNYIISRIRDLCAKSGPYFTYQRVSNYESSSKSMPTVEPLSLREEFYCEIVLLIRILQVQWNIYCHTIDHQLYIPKIDQQLLNEEDQFIRDTRLQFVEKISQANSDWYSNKIAETRKFIDKNETEFSLQSQDVGSSSIQVHEELRREIRLLTHLQWIDLRIIINSQSNGSSGDHKFEKELQVHINEVNKFSTKMKLQLEGKNHVNDSNWYHEKIAESRTLIAKRYLAFPFPSQNVGSSTINMSRVKSKALVDYAGYTKQQYQIFLSFRGEDTRYGFTWNLYAALKQEGFEVFMDDEGLQRGDSIAQVLMETIENSKLSIIVFSENYADSTWCLNEVVKILECKQKKNQLVWPIFYKVEPSDVRHQRNSYEKAMTKQETRYGKDSEDVKKWRSSLSQVCDLKAFHYKENSGYERAFIQDIINDAVNIRDRL